LDELLKLILPEYFQETECSIDDFLISLAAQANVVQAHQPHEPQQKILHNRKIVVVLRRINNSLPQEPVLTGVLVEESPVHLEVPPELVNSGTGVHNEPQIVERVLPVVAVHRTEVVLEEDSGDDKKRCGVLESVGQVRKSVKRNQAGRAAKRIDMTL